MFQKSREGTELFEVYVDGERVVVEAGETVAAVLLRTAPHFARTTAVKGGRRAPYCMMGVCFDCLASIDGVASVQSCLVEVRQGMQIKRQMGRKEIS